MKRQTVALVLGICLAVNLAFLFPALAAEVKVGDNVAKLQFPGTIFPDDQKYLGLAKPGPFTAKDVQAPFILVDVFSTTCPHCVHQAPTLNALFDLVSQDAKVKDKLKFIAVGALDNDFKIKFWKQNFQVKFALLPDMDGKLFKDLDLPGTPVTIILDKDGKVVFKHVGSIESAEGTLKEIKAALKL